MTTAPGGHLELSFDKSILPDPSARYVVALCGTTLFEADSAKSVSGLHTLAQPFLIEPGEHEMTITGTAQGKSFDRSLKVSIPRRSSGYSFNAVQCRIDAATTGKSDEQALGFRLADAEVPLFQGAKRAAPQEPIDPQAHHSSGCSIKA